MSTDDQTPMKSGLHDCPVVIAPNNFKFKSLSSFAVNAFLGCPHGCRFCYASGTSANWQKDLLASYGVKDPVEEWGAYVLVRPWDEMAFMRSLAKAEKTPPFKLNADGNRAVMFSSTTDPYQVVRNASAEKQKMLNSLARSNMRRALELIRDHSTLNVRVLTRSPLAREDFDLFKSLGNRLLLGTSLPTLDDGLSRLYEPKAPAPSQRLKLLLDAHKEGIPTFVAVAPVFPECGYEGMVEVFNAVKEADPVTIFMEPVNIRLGIAQRIQEQALEVGKEIDMTPYTDKEAWAKYAIDTLRDAERAAEAAGVLDRLHLWPDYDDLGAKKVRKAQAEVWDHPSGMSYDAWLDSKWNRISEWPGKDAG